jgi:hypothetical protein
LTQVLPEPQDVASEQKVGTTPQVAGTPLGSHFPHAVHTLSGPQSSSDLQRGTHCPELQKSSALQPLSSLQAVGGT